MPADAPVRRWRVTILAMVTRQRGHTVPWPTKIAGIRDPGDPVVTGLV